MKLREKVARKRTERNLASKRKRWMRNRGMTSQAYAIREARKAHDLYALKVQQARVRADAESDRLDAEYLKEGPLKRRPGIVRRALAWMRRTR